MRKAVVMAGGSGTRLWPLSRRALPKQFLAFDRHGTLLQQTWERLRRCLDARDIYVCTLPRYASLVREQLPGLDPERLILEPEPRGTGPAWALVAATLQRTVGDVPVAAISADLWVADAAAFAAALDVAFQAVEREPEAVVALGVQPERAATGFGYIEVGAAWKVDSRLFEAVSFVEKPRRVEAEAFLASGRYLWNASFYVWRPARLLSLIASHRPEIGALITELKRLEAEGAPPAARAECYARMPAVSIDHAVMQRARPLLTVPARLGWNDLGTWRSVAEVMPEGSPGNHVSVRDGRVWVLGDGRLVATVGLDNVAIVSTPDALLVCNLDQVEALGEVIEQLKSAGREELL